MMGWNEFVPPHFSISGLVAQLGEQGPYITTIQFYIWACSSVGERSVRIREVVGSTPIRSTIKSCEILHFTAFLQLFGGFDVDAKRAATILTVAALDLLLIQQNLFLRDI